MGSAVTPIVHQSLLAGVQLQELGCLGVKLRETGLAFAIASARWAASV